MGGIGCTDGGVLVSLGWVDQATLVTEDTACRCLFGGRGCGGPITTGADDIATLDALDALIGSLREPRENGLRMNKAPITRASAK
jgi:hypothetical protein